MKSLLQYILSLITLMFGLILTSTCCIYAYLVYPGPLKTQEIIAIEPGSTISETVFNLAGRNIIYFPRLFLLIIKATEKNLKLRAGEYRINQRATPKQILKMLKLGEVIYHRFVITECETSARILDAVEKNPRLKGNIINKYREGELFPETYYYVYGDSKQMLLDRIASKMRSTLDELWPKRDPKLKITKADTIILASVVEAETAENDERHRIAAVFHNRLRLGMSLQADPTVIYAITNGQYKLQRSLTKTDLKIDSSYNTYMTKGLPPGPICNPGREAIKAALQPAQTNDLYFVVKPSGRGHNFSRNYDEHRQFVQEYINTKEPS